MGVLLSFVSSIFWGASDFVGGVSSRKSMALHATLWAFAGATAASAVAILVNWAPFTRQATVAGLVAGLFAVAGFVALYASLAAAAMGVVTVLVGAAEAVVPVAVGVVWHHESLSALAWTGILVALVGITLIGLAEGGGGEGEGHERSKPSWQPLALAVASGVFFGFSVVALDAAPADSGFVTPTVEVAVGLVCMIAVAWLVRHVAVLGRVSRVLGITTGTEPASRDAKLWGLLAGVFLAIANITLLLALRNGELAVVGVVLCLYPITTAILARVFLKERLTAKHIIGIGIALAGCVMLALF